MSKDIVYTGKDNWGDERTYTLGSELALYKEIKKDVWSKYKKPMADSGREASDEKLLDFYKQNKDRFLKNVNGEKRVIDDFKEHLKGVKKGTFKASVLDSRGNMGASIMRDVAEDELRAKLVIAELKRRGLVDKTGKTILKKSKSKEMATQTSMNFTKRGCNSTKAAKILKENREEYGKLLKKEIAKQKGKKSVTKAAKAASKKHHKMTWPQALNAASK